LKRFLLCSILLFASTAYAQPHCTTSSSDSDGDGFGWENNSTCIVPAQSGSGLPACSSAVFDSDGDGFGWESNASCRITPTVAPASEPASRPVCLSFASDPDGDGFGWENGRSCVVRATQSTVSSITLPEEIVQLTLPACSNERFDPDRDGFGWENSRSCTFRNAGDGGNSITDVVLVTGQSNALGAETGRLDPNSFVSHLDNSVQRVYAYSQSGWGIAGLRQIWDLNWYPRGDIAGQPSNNFAFHFGKSLVRNDPNAVVGIIMVTAPGKSIDHWDPEGDFFTEIDRKVGAALQSLPGNVKVQGILWHQGESDFYSTDHYRWRLQQLIGNFRGRSWFASDGLFVCGETLNAPVNEQLRALNTDGDARTGCVSATGLESLGDEVHFNAASLRVLGSRYADKYRSMSR